MLRCHAPLFPLPNTQVRASDVGEGRNDGSAVVQRLARFCCRHVR